MRNPSSTRPVWRIRGRDLSLDRPLILGILNVTPDSFSDGGEHAGLDSALAWARAMRDLGADMIDVGGESTRPGFAENAVPLEEERRRVIPVVRALASEGFLVSVDTSKPEIMLEAAQAGAHVINDIRGFELPGALEAAARTDCGLVLMDRTPLGAEESAVERVLEYLEERLVSERPLSRISTSLRGHRVLPKTGALSWPLFRGSRRLAGRREPVSRSDGCPEAVRRRCLPLNAAPLLCARTTVERCGKRLTYGRHFAIPKTVSKWAGRNHLASGRSWLAKAPIKEKV